MKDIMGMMAKAKEMQERMGAMQAEVEAMEETGEAGAGAVKVTLRGTGEMTALTIDPSLLKEDEGEIVEDLVLAAHAKARGRLDEAKADKMREMTAGLPLPPGMKLPF